MIRKILRLDNVILYKKDKGNIAADPSSRLHEQGDTGEVHEVTTLQNGWISDITRSYDNDTETHELNASIASQQPQRVHYSFTQGLIKFKGKIYVRVVGLIRKSIL